MFEQPKGSEHPLLINQFGTERRMCLAFGVERLDDVGKRVADVLEMQPPQGLMEKIRGLQKLKSIADARPKTVGKGACQEIVLRGDDVDLGLLPIQRCWPGDPAPFITLPAVITHDPQTGGRNVGMYRMQVIDKNTTFMHWQIHKDGRADYLATDGRIEVAVALGLDPITAYSASAPLPKHIDEFMIAGFLRGDAVELVKGVSVGVEVPARAEIVLEGYIDKDEVGEEGPFGDHTGYYTAAEPFPVFHVTAMTMRRDAIYPSIVVGKPPQEDAWLGKATERIFLPAVRTTLPEVVDYDLPVAGAFHNCCLVSIRKQFPGHAAKVMHALWGLGMMSLTKCIVVVDAIGRRARLRAGALLCGRQRRPEARRDPLGRPARPSRPRARAAVLRRQARHRRDREVAGGGRAAVARRDRDEPRDQGARHAPLERLRNRLVPAPLGRRLR